MKHLNSELKKKKIDFQNIYVKNHMVYLGDILITC